MDDATTPPPATLAEAVQRLAAIIASDKTLDIAEQALSRGQSYEMTMRITENEQGIRVQINGRRIAASWVIASFRDLNQIQ